jgi:RNA 3'-terminal phosphate cyclase (ATP)
MAALTQQALRLENVRGGTQYPGLDYEDILVIQALQNSCAAETTGVELGSQAFSFLPTRRPQGIRHTLDPDLPEGRRGPNALVVAGTLVPVLARTGMYSRLEAVGETYGHHSLSFDYFANVTVGAWKRMGLYCFPDLLAAGFGRESKGHISIDIEPSMIQGVTWEQRGRLIGCKAHIVTANLPASVAQRGEAHLKNLGQYSGIPVSCESTEVRAARPGAHVTVWAQYDSGFGGATAMGARGIRMETLVQTAFEETLNWIGSDATVDPFLADQMLLAGVMSEQGSSFKTSRLTQRFLTSVWVVKQFLPIHLTVKGVLDGPGQVTIKR